MRRLIALLFLSFFATSLHAGGEDLPREFKTNTGDDAPAAVSKLLREQFPERKTAKATLLHFVNCESGRCEESLKALEGFLWRPLKEEEFRLLGIASASGKGEAEDLRERAELSFPLVTDEESELFHLFAEEGVPRTIVFDSDGKIAYQHAGWRPGREAEFRAVVEALLNGDSVPSADGLPTGYSDKLHARDIRGQEAPDVPVEEWVNEPPEEQEGKFLLVDFWATWCGPCVVAMNEAEKHHGQFEEQLVTKAVSDEQLSTVKQFVEQHNITQPVGVDTQARAKQELAVRAIPHAFLANPEGKVVWQGHPMELWRNNAEELKKFLSGGQEEDPGEE